MNTSLSFSLSALLSSAVLLGGAGCGAPGDSSAAGGDDLGNSGCGGDGHFDCRSVFVDVCYCL